MEQLTKTRGSGRRVGGARGSTHKISSSRRLLPTGDEQEDDDKPHHKREHHLNFKKISLDLEEDDVRKLLGMDDDDEEHDISGLLTNQSIGAIGPISPEPDQEQEEEEEFEEQSDDETYDEEDRPIDPNTFS